MRHQGTLLTPVSFFLTLVSATLAGVQWLHKSPLDLDNFSAGLLYSALLLSILAAHQIGHYVAARIHKVDATSPLFLPFPSFIGPLPFGTLGAVTRITGTMSSRRAMFDIGASGPIAGFVTSCIVLVLGFSHLPARDYLFAIHPEYATLNSIPTGGLTFGSSIMYSFVARVVAPANAFVPPMNEMYHYPFLCVGWFGLFFTAVNLLPIGRLDGGHIAYSMFGRGYRAVERGTVSLLIALGLAGIPSLVGSQFTFGWYGWLLWCSALLATIRWTKLRPSTEDDSPIDGTRRAIGMVCWLILITSFSPAPFSM